MIYETGKLRLEDNVEVKYGPAADYLRYLRGEGAKDIKISFTGGSVEVTGQLIKEKPVVKEKVVPKSSGVLFRSRKKK